MILHHLNRLKPCSYKLKHLIVERMINIPHTSITPSVFRFWQNHSESPKFSILYNYLILANYELDLGNCVIISLL